MLGYDRIKGVNSQEVQLLSVFLSLITWERLTLVQVLFLIDMAQLHI